MNDDCLARGEAFAGATCIDNLCILPTVPPPDMDAGTDAPVLPDQWKCIGNVKPPVPGPKTTVQLTITLGDLIHPTRSVSDFVVVHVCDKLDLACNPPTLGAPFHPDQNGQAQFMVPNGFDGYIEVLPAVQVPVYAPTLIFLGSAVVDDYVYMPTPLLALADLPALVQATGGGVVDTTLGGLFFQAADCNRAAASGVSGALDMMGPDTRRFYVVNGLPSQNTTVTDVSGYGGFINVPVGVRYVSGALQPDNIPFGKISVNVRAGFFSYSLLSPQPQ